MTFIDTYLKMVDDTEPPLLYHKWCALGALSATIGRRVWVRRGHERIFPNMYVVLVGPSGVRKSVALGLARSLVRSLGRRVTLVPESLTRRAFLEALTYATDQVDDEGNFKRDEGRSYQKPEVDGPLQHFSASIFASELATLLRRDNTEFFADLTDLYDSSDEPWEYRTAHVGGNKLHGPCVTIVGASAPDWVTLMLPWETVGGGFTARVLFINATRKRKTVLRPRWGAQEQALRRACVDHLKQVSDLEGELQLEPAAWTAYDTFYQKQEEAIAAGKPPLRDPRLSRYIERRPTHLLKVAACLSMSRSADMRVLEEDIHGAIYMLAEAEGAGMGSIFEGKGSNPLAGVSRRILLWIAEHGGSATEAQILQAFGDDIDAGQLFRIKTTLQKQGAIEPTGTTGSPKWSLPSD